VNDPRYTASNFRDALLAKPPGWVYGDSSYATQEALEIALFLAPGGAEDFLEETKTSANARFQRYQDTILTYTYDVPNPPTPVPGHMDALATAIALVTDPAELTPAELEAVLPDAPGPVDLMAVWRQGQRANAQWDGSVAAPLHRNVAASLGVIGVPANVNVENAIRTTRFNDALPPPPYPFDVDRAAADRGFVLFQVACAGCHAPGNPTAYTPAQTGTDPNRAELFSTYVVDGFRELLRESCDDPVACFDENGDPLPDDEVARITGGYSALPLGGVWATAPYLHNGSVPTLYHLLTGTRPATFYRGNLTYDTTLVGFTWDSAGPGAVLYDTSQAGRSNTGHTGPQFNGVFDWNAEPAKLWDLIEYLKTL
jgi:mono/diheme cytochrome c family protein